MYRGLKKYGSVKVHLHAAIERGVASEHSHRARTAEEVDVPPVGLDTRPFLRPVPETKIQAPVLALGHRDACGNLLRLLSFLTHRLNVGELEHFQGVQLALAFEQTTLPIDLPRTKAELPPHHVVIDARIAGNLNRTVLSEDARFGDELDDAASIVRSVRLGHPHRGVRVAVVLQAIERRLATGLEQRPICRLPGFDGHARIEKPARPFGKYVEPDELDALHAHRLTFGDANEDIDGGLILAEFDIERGHPRVGKSAVAVKRHDAFDIGLELFAAEIVLLAPGDLRTGAGGEHRLQLPLLDSFQTLEFQAVDPDARFFFTSGGADQGSGAHTKERCTHKRTDRHRCRWAYSQGVPDRCDEYGDAEESLRGGRVTRA